MGEVIAHQSPSWAGPFRFAGPIDCDEPSTVTPIGVVVPFDFELDWEYWRS